jgi:beta-glucosidase
MNLCGFERVSLQPGETKTATFRLPSSALELINRQEQRVVEPGAFKVMMGSSSTDIRLNGGFEVVSDSR